MYNTHDYKFHKFVQYIYEGISGNIIMTMVIYGDSVEKWHHERYRIFNGEFNMQTREQGSMEPTVLFMIVSGTL